MVPPPFGSKDIPIALFGPVCQHIQRIQHDGSAELRGRDAGGLGATPP